MLKQWLENFWSTINPPKLRSAKELQDVLVALVNDATPATLQARIAACATLAWVLNARLKTPTGSVIQYNTIGEYMSPLTMLLNSRLIQDKATADAAKSHQHNKDKAVDVLTCDTTCKEPSKLVPKLTTVTDINSKKKPRPKKK